jgi:uncharacterized membrane protein
MDIGLSFGYIFKDRDWLTKVLIGALILMVSLPLTFVLVGLLGLAIVAGYSLEVLRNVRQGSTQPLPEWRDRWGEWLMSGLKLLLVLFIWSLPAILLNVPSDLFRSLAWRADGLVELFVGLWAAAFGLLSFLAWVAFALATPALYIRMAEHEDIAQAFQFREIYEFTRDNLGNVIIAVLVAFLIGIGGAVLGSLAGVLLCVIGLAITLPAAVFITNLITVHLYAQIGLGTESRALAAQASAAGTELAVGTPAEAPVEPVEVEAIESEAADVESSDEDAQSSS